MCSRAEGGAAVTGSIAAGCAGWAGGLTQADSGHPHQPSPAQPGPARPAGLSIDCRKVTPGLAARRLRPPCLPPATSLLPAGRAACWAVVHLAPASSHPHIDHGGHARAPTATTATLPAPRLAMCRWPVSWCYQVCSSRVRAGEVARVTRRRARRQLWGPDKPRAGL